MLVKLPWVIFFDKPNECARSPGEPQHLLVDQGESGAKVSLL